MHGQSIFALKKHNLFSKDIWKYFWIFESKSIDFISSSSVPKFLLINILQKFSWIEMLSSIIKCGGQIIEKFIHDYIREKAT